MHINSQFENVENYLKITDFENFFNVYSDKNGDYFFNLNSNVYINVDEDQLSKLTLDHDSHWPLISYKIYGTPRLTWLLLKVNDVRTENIFNIKHAGETILYLSNDKAQTIINKINQIDE